MSPVIPFTSTYILLTLKWVTFVTFLLHHSLLAPVTEPHLLITRHSAVNTGQMKRRPFFFLPLFFLNESDIK